MGTGLSTGNGGTGLAGDGGAGGINFTTAEQSTGLTWVDEKVIYQKTISIGNLPNTTAADTSHGITGLDTVINQWGNADNGTLQLPLPYVDPTALGAQILIRATDTNVTVETGNDRSGYTGFVTLQYTKT